MSQSFDRLFKIKKESLKLLEDQGYDIENEKVLFEYSLDDFEKYYTKVLPSQESELVSFLKKENLNTIRSYMSSFYQSKKNKDEYVIVYFATSTEKKVSEIDIASFCRMIQHFEVSNAILISEVPLSTAAESLCTEFVPCRNSKGVKKYGCFIQHFEDSELFFNPIKHSFVPEQRLLTQEEVDDLIKVDKIRPRQLPQISALDPIAKRLGARPDDIIEITRQILIPGTLLQEELAYRGVYMPQKEKKDRATKK
jgi:DNA-directed RNA polymerase subunit H (RpoH/RPB5)